MAPSPPKCARPTQAADQITRLTLYAGTARIPYRAPALADILALLNKENTQSFGLGKLQSCKDTGRAASNDDNIKNFRHYA